jgi:hypothetical protein
MARAGSSVMENLVERANKYCFETGDICLRGGDFHMRVWKAETAGPPHHRPEKSMKLVFWLVAS